MGRVTVLRDKVRFAGWRKEEYPITADWIQRYRYCRVCDKKVTRAQLAFALDRAETPICSAACRKKDVLKTFACCLKAKVLPCVCAYSFTCKEHGTRHTGTHD